MVFADFMAWAIPADLRSVQEEQQAASTAGSVRVPKRIASVRHSKRAGRSCRSFPKSPGLAEAEMRVSLNNITDRYEKITTRAAYPYCLKLSKKAVALPYTIVHFVKLTCYNTKRLIIGNFF